MGPRRGLHEIEIVKNNMCEAHAQSMQHLYKHIHAILSKRTIIIYLMRNFTAKYV